MFIKYFKLLIILFLLLNHNILFAKNKENLDFNSKKLSKYFSALISFDNKENKKALAFFNTSQDLIDQHDPYLKEYIFSLVSDGQVNKALKILKYNLNKENSNFFEAYLLLSLDSLKKKNYKKNDFYQAKLLNLTGGGAYETIIAESLKSFSYLFENKKISLKKKSFGNLSEITNTFESCYINQKQTSFAFLNLINNQNADYSRYIFFYINYLIEQNKIEEAKQITEKVEILNSSLLVSQAKNWIDKNKINEFNKIFSCQNELDVLGEFFFLISNLYSAQKNYVKSNFYLNISIFLNPKFRFNLSLMSENHYVNGDYKKTNLILNEFKNTDDVYYWYKIKKKSKIILKEKNEASSFDYINLHFNKIKNPSLKIIFDMANISKNYEEYKVAIEYYDDILGRINSNSSMRGDLLYRRGGSHERLGDYKNSDKDLLKSLEINPDDAYVLNYLAYSWLERKYKIDVALQMLEKAYEQKNNDPYIIDSIGWAYYLVDNYVKAEKFLKRAVELMPDDPVVNDHYGDILWRLDRKIQARYFWTSVLNLEKIEDDMRKNIRDKIINGVQNS